jgi:hypothetical protein
MCATTNIATVNTGFLCLHFREGTCGWQYTVMTQSPVIERSSGVLTLLNAHYQVLVNMTEPLALDYVHLHSTNYSTITLIYHLGLYNRPEVAAVPGDVSPTPQKKKCTWSPEMGGRQPGI